MVDIAGYEVGIRHNQIGQTSTIPTKGRRAKIQMSLFLGGSIYAFFPRVCFLYLTTVCDFNCIRMSTHSMW